MGPGLAGLKSEYKCGAEVWTIKLSTAFVSSSFSTPLSHFYGQMQNNQQQELMTNLCMLKYVHHYVHHPTSELFSNPFAGSMFVLT